MENDIKLGNFLRNTGTAILCLLIPIVNIFILIWLLVLVFQVIDAAKKVGTERGAKELLDFANLYLLSFLIGIGVVIASTAIMVTQILSINWYSLGYSGMYAAIMGLMGTFFLVNLMSILVSIVDILAWSRMKQFFEKSIETGPAKQKGVDGANYGFIGAILGLIPIVSIVGLILSIMGYFTTGSAFLKMSNEPVPSVGYAGYVASSSAIPPSAFVPSSAIPPSAFVPNEVPFNPGVDANLRPGQAQPITPLPSSTVQATVNPAKPTFCIYCGHSLPQNEDVRFCPGCGASLK
nr:hypothetical protein [Candidatus Sigynarchaeota archaeon]